MIISVAQENTGQNPTSTSNKKHLQTKNIWELTQIVK